MLIGCDGRDERDRGERDEHRHATHDHRHARRDHAPEHQQQRERRERQADQLAALEVLLRDLLDVAVERGAARERDLQPRAAATIAAWTRLEGVRRPVGGEVERDHLVDGAAVVAHLVRREACEAGRP